MLGQKIMLLRKEKGCTQEELGKELGVSMQAVSKWENGGVPDVSLLPQIADYFGVTIDSLFDRKLDYENLENVISKYLANMSYEKRVEKALSINWAVQLGVGGNDNIYENETAEAMKKYNNRDSGTSRFIANEGILMSRINNQIAYSLTMEEPNGGWKTYLETEEKFLNLFSLLAQKDFFQTLLWLGNREQNPFTDKLLMKKMGITKERSEEILNMLKKYNLVEISKLELDDEEVTIYKQNINPSLIPFLVFADDLISHHQTYIWYTSNREKPFL